MVKTRSGFSAQVSHERGDSADEDERADDAKQADYPSDPDPKRGPLNPPMPR